MDSNDEFGNIISYMMRASDDEESQEDGRQKVKKEEEERGRKAGAKSEGSEASVPKKNYDFVLMAYERAKKRLKDMDEELERLKRKNKGLEKMASGGGEELLETRRQRGALKEQVRALKQKVTALESENEKQRLAHEVALKEMGVKRESIEKRLEKAESDKTRLEGENSRLLAESYQFLKELKVLKEKASPAEAQRQDEGVDIGRMSDAGVQTPREQRTDAESSSNSAISSTSLSETCSRSLATSGRFGAKTGFEKKPVAAASKSTPKVSRIKTPASSNKAPATYRSASRRPTDSETETSDTEEEYTPTKRKGCASTSRRTAKKQKKTLSVSSCQVSSSLSADHELIANFSKDEIKLQEEEEVRAAMALISDHHLTILSETNVYMEEVNADYWRRVRAKPFAKLLSHLKEGDKVIGVVDDEFHAKVQLMELVTLALCVGPKGNVVMLTNKGDYERQLRSHHPSLLQSGRVKVVVREIQSKRRNEGFEAKAPYDFALVPTKTAATTIKEQMKMGSYALAYNDMRFFQKKGKKAPNVFVEVKY